MKTIIELKQIVMRRGGTPILNGIDWTIREREHWALLGANGAGKTSLLKVITGYEWPTEGEVTVLGERFGQCDIAQLRRMIGWVSSSLEERVHGGDRVVDVVLSGFDASLGTYREFSEEEIQTALAALSALASEPIAERVYGYCSQGERQRVLIARALVRRPRILILDEPCGGLDPASRLHLLDDLAALAARPKAPTIIYVTHQIEEIDLWIKQTALLKDGRMIATGPTREVITTPLLTEAFGVPCKVDFDGQRHWLRVGHDR